MGLPRIGSVPATPVGFEPTLDARYLRIVNNLSDLSSVSTARTNLGLGTIATQNTPLSIGNGGTNNTSAYTAGSVIFSDGSTLTQNNSNLFWDNTHNRLGIGNASPGFSLDVQDTSTTPINVQSNSTNSTALAINNTSTGGHNIGLVVTGQLNGSGAGRFVIFDSTTSTTNLLMNSTDGSMALRKNGVLDWGADANFAGTSVDTGIGRNAAGIAEINNGVLGTFRDLQARNGIFTSTSSSVLVAGANGATFPVLSVDASNTNVTTGLTIQGQAQGFSTKLIVTDSGSNANLIADAKGNGTIGLNISSTNAGLVTIGNTTSQAGVAINGPETLTGKITQYNNVSTSGWGTPSVYGQGRSTAQTAAVASVAAYTVGASDGSFIVSANANVTTFVAGTFNVTVAYTDETNTGQTLKLSFSTLTGTLGVAIAASGPFEGIPAHIHCKASTAITIATSGTFTNLTYNVEGVIQQIA